MYFYAYGASDREKMDVLCLSLKVTGSVPTVQGPHRRRLSASRDPLAHILRVLS